MDLKSQNATRAPWGASRCRRSSLSPNLTFPDLKITPGLPRDIDLDQTTSISCSATEEYSMEVIWLASSLFPYEAATISSKRK
jgi:hypothetical protein